MSIFRCTKVARGVQNRCVSKGRQCIRTGGLAFLLGESVRTDGKQPRSARPYRAGEVQTLYPRVLTLLRFLREAQRTRLHVGIRSGKRQTDKSLFDPVWASNTDKRYPSVPSGLTFPSRKDHFGHQRNLVFIR